MAMRNARTPLCHYFAGQNFANTGRLCANAPLQRGQKHTTRMPHGNQPAILQFNHHNSQHQPFSIVRTERNTITARSTLFFMCSTIWIVCCVMPAPIIRQRRVWGIYWHAGLIAEREMNKRTLFNETKRERRTNKQCISGNAEKRSTLDERGNSADITATVFFLRNCRGAHMKHRNCLQLNWK